MKKQNIILAVLGVALVAAAGVMMYEAKKAEAAADAMQQLINAQQREASRSVRVILTSGDCNSEPNMEGQFWDGNTAAAYCAANGVGDFHPRLEQQCFREGLRQAAGYIDFEEPTKEDYVALACGIAEKYPASTEDWQDNDLTDSLESLLGDYLSRN